MAFNFLIIVALTWINYYESKGHPTKVSPLNKTPMLSLREKFFEGFTMERVNFVMIIVFPILLSAFIFCYVLFIVVN